jgi:hypothetical protein
MDPENNPPIIPSESSASKTSASKFFGYVLLTPAVLSVIMFVIDLIPMEKEVELFKNLSRDWLGHVYYDQGGGGYTSALPLYFGLMAIAGAYLIKDRS